MIRWCIQRMLGPWCAPASWETVWERRPRPDTQAPRTRDENAPELHGVVLSANVFIAVVRATAIPLLAGRPVIVRPSRRAGVFPTLWIHALHRHVPSLAPHIGLATFASAETACFQALFGACTRVSVYGRDSVIDTLHQHVPTSSTRFEPHGSGISALYVPASAFASSEILHAWVSLMVQDIVAFDQRGCLSPQVIWVERRQDNPHLKRLAEALDRALDAAQTTWPRGIATEHEKTVAARWRETGAAIGELWTGTHHAICIEEHDTLRGAPGRRHISMRACASPETFARSIHALGDRLKMIGICASPQPGAAHNPCWNAVLGALNRYEYSGLVAQAGDMHTPAMDAKWDRISPW